MKKFKSLVLAVIGLLYSICVSAHDFEVDGIYYNITSEEDKTVEVTYPGEEPHSYINEYSCAVSISESVTYNGCCYNVTSIGEHAFKSCSGLTSVVIPNSVTSIGESAFRDCSGLTSVVIPNSVTNLGDCAFEGCSSLESVVIGAGVRKFGEYVFSECTTLKSVIIGNEVIGDYAFLCCYDLNSITIPKSVTQIGFAAFARCHDLTSIVVEDSNPIYDSRGGCNAIIETSSNTLIQGCLTTTIPNSVTTIGEAAFVDCVGLTTITIPNSVTTI